MESATQLISGIKSAINNVKLKDDITNATYVFSFSETMNKVSITSEDGEETLYPANIVYENGLKVKMIGQNFELSSFIHAGKVLMNLNNGAIMLRGTQYL